MYTFNNTLYILLPHNHQLYVQRIIKTFSIKIKEDVGTSKPKKHANKVGILLSFFIVSEAIVSILADQNFTMNALEWC